LDKSLSAEIRWPTLGLETIERLKSAFNGESISCEVKSGDQVYSVITVPLSGMEDDFSEVLCVVQNVTDRKRMEEGLLNALEREKELGELKSRFVTMASHEFRTPLTAILASTFVLENYTGENFDKEKKVYTNRIKRSVNNLTTILNEFLSLEKLEEDKVRVHHSEVNIPEYMQDLIDELELIKRPGQKIEYHHHGKSIAHVDHHILWSIASNLLSNALKYSKPGDHIQVTSTIENDSLMLIVNDPGIGIPPDEQRYIFGRFYRARNATNIEGTGLGLHIVQKYVHLINGHIIFESMLNVGTKFTVTLPAGLVCHDTESEN
jgi:signal transduction histidine kinase